MKRRILLQLAALAFLSVLCLGGALFLLMHPVDIAPLPAEGVSYVLLNEPPALNIAGPDRASLTTISARPLFVPSRRPFKPPRPTPPAAPPRAAPPVQPAAPVLVDLLLKGVAYQPNAARAMIVSSSHPDGIWLQKGANIDGWTIRHISRDSVSLAQAERVIELRLYPMATPGFGLE